MRAAEIEGQVGRQCEGAWGWGDERDAPPLARGGARQEQGKSTKNVRGSWSWLRRDHPLSRDRQFDREIPTSGLSVSIQMFATADK